MTARRDTLWLGAAAVGLAFGFLVHGLGRPSLWVDELFTVQIATAEAFDQVLAGVRAHERRPPLYYLLLHGWQRWAGPLEFNLRFLSVLAAGLAVAGAVRLGRVFGGPRVGRLTGLLLALSPALILYGRALRAYTLAAFLTVLATLAFTRLHKRGGHAVYFVAAFALLATDSMAVAVLFAHNLAYFAARARRASLPSAATWLALQAGLVIAGAVWLAMGRAAMPGQFPPADLADTLSGQALKLGYSLYAFTAGETLFPWNPMAWPALGVGLWAASRSRARLRNHGRLIVAALALAPLLLAILLTATVITGHSFVTLPSRALPALPFVLMLIAAGLAGAGRPRWRAGVLLGLFCLANLAGLVNLYAGREYLNPIYNLPAREIAALVARAAQPGDVVVADWDSAVPFYLRAANPALHLLETPPPEAAQAQLQSLHPAPVRVWVVALGRDRTRALAAAPELDAWLRARYPASLRWGYGEQDAAYRAVKEALLGQPAYRYRATVTLYLAGW